MSLRKKLRALIAAPGLAVLPGAYDALSARIIAREGFDAVMAGGYAANGSMLAQADMGQSNRRDYADHYARICAAVDIPVFADGDTGFGGPQNVRQMVRAFEAAGVAALFITDQTFPNRCNYLPGKQVVPGPYMATLSHAAGREHLGHAELEAAGVAAASYPSLTLFAAAQAVRGAMRELKQ